MSDKALRKGMLSFKDQVTHPETVEAFSNLCSTTLFHLFDAMCQESRSIRDHVVAIGLGWDDTVKAMPFDADFCRRLCRGERVVVETHRSTHKSTLVLEHEQALQDAQE